MAIWLGKQYLEQRDSDSRYQHQSNGENNLLKAIQATEEIATDDLPEVE
jgi:hypothetical protein